ncbi:unnamed protein product [Colias eurytheme]|nr:unnamed protein product [Colias eurytheme]
MALGGSNYLQHATMLEQLLEEINFQRTKEMRQLMKDDSGFVVLQGTTYWTDLFVRHFLFQEEQSIDCDDLLFFVRKRHVKGSSRYLPKYEGGRYSRHAQSLSCITICNRRGRAGPATRTHGARSRLTAASPAGLFAD